MTASAISFTVRASLTRADIPALCDALAKMLCDRDRDRDRDRDGGVVICDVSGVTRPDVVTIGALARLRLTTRRHGWRLVVSEADAGLLALADLLGLADALLQPVRQLEQREETGGVEEVVDRRDPPG